MNNNQSVFPSTIVERRWLSKKVYELVCRRPENYTFLPGQHCSIILDDEDREYSILLQPGELELRFLIKIVPGGRLSSELGNAPIGTKIMLGRPRGYLVERESDRERIFIGTGTGIAPLIAMLTSGTSVQYFIHGARDSESLFYRDLIAGQCENYIPCLSRGSIDEKQNSKLFIGYVSEYVENKLKEGSFEFYLCGNWSMIRDVTIVIDTRFPNAKIYSEGFY